MKEKYTFKKNNAEQFNIGPSPWIGIIQATVQKEDFARQICDALNKDDDREIPSSNVKTIQQWEESDMKEWDEFFKPGDIIDEEVHDYMHEYVPARFFSRRTETKRIPGAGFTQAGECENEIDGVRYYATFVYYEDSKTYMYLGILPAFKKPKF